MERGLFSPEVQVITDRNERVLHHMRTQDIDIPFTREDLEGYAQLAGYDRLPIAFALLAGRFGERLQDGLVLPVGFSDEVAAILTSGERAGEHDHETVDYIDIDDRVVGEQYRLERVTAQQQRTHKPLGSLRLRHPTGLIHDLAQPAFRRAITVMDEALLCVLPR